MRRSSSAEGCLKALAALRRPSVQSDTDIPPTLPTTDGYNWEPLAEITVEKRPVKLRLPDGATAKINRWNDLLTKTTCWLLDKDCLDRKSLEIMRRGNSNNETVVVTTQPQPSGKRKKYPEEEVLDGVWVRTDYNPENCVLNAIAIVKDAACHHPSQFRIRFS